MGETQSEPLGHKRKFQFHSIRFYSNLEGQSTPAESSPKELAATAPGRIDDPRVYRQFFQGTGLLEGQFFRRDDEDGVCRDDLSSHMFGKKALLGQQCDRDVDLA